MEKQVFLNGSFISDSKAVIHYRDLSFQRGYGIFDFFRLAENKPLFLDDHLQRFYRSAREMHLSVSMEKDELKAVILELIERNHLPNTGIRLGLTGGFSEDGFTLAKPNLIVSQHSFFPPTETQRTEGIRLLSHPYQRQLPHVKSIEYLMAVWLQPLKAQKGVDDFLYHSGGCISECPRSNFFLVMADDIIVTPAENVLEGITRSHVIAIAQEHYKVEERTVRLEEISTAKEAFITSTTKQILRVAQIDDKVFNGAAITSNLLRLFQSAYCAE